MTSGPLYLQERTRIIGMHPNRRTFARAITAYAETLNARPDPQPFRNIGVWELVGMTGSWAQVLGLYEFSKGWASLSEMIGQTMQQPAPELAEAYRAVEATRSGGEDEILAPLPGCPTHVELATGEAGGSLLVVDEARVEPGTEARYGAALLEQWSRSDSGRLVGLYRGALTDGLVIAYRVTSRDAYVAMKEAGDNEAALRALRKDWRQQLWTAAAGSRFADADADYGDRDIRGGQLTSGGSARCRHGRSRRADNSRRRRGPG